jgi:hypothetical protein
MAIWAVLTRAIAVAGVIHSDRWISIWSTTTAFPSFGTSMRKNQVAKRFGPPSGGTQNEKGTRPEGSRWSDASSAASRTAAARAAAISKSVSWPITEPESSGSTRPPGKTHMFANCPRELRWSSSTSIPAGLCRSGITVAAFISSVSTTGASTSRADAPLLIPSCSFDIWRPYFRFRPSQPANADFGGRSQRNHRASDRMSASEECTPLRSEDPLVLRPLHVCLGEQSLYQGEHWSGCRDLNPGPPAPKAGALPSCATSREMAGAIVRR